MNVLNVLKYAIIISLIAAVIVIVGKEIDEDEANRQARATQESEVLAQMETVDIASDSMLVRNVRPFVTKFGLECISYFTQGPMASGISCNWEKYNREVAEKE